MKSASFYAAYIVKKLWTLAAVLLVVVAVSISLLRYTLPHLDKQKYRVEQWLSEQYGVELVIGELSAGWSGIGPTLLLRNVELKQSENSPIGLDVSETQVELDFWGTVLAQQINSRRFELSGLHLMIDLEQMHGENSDFPIVDALQSLFLEQLQQFSVRDSIVEIRTARDKQLIDIQRLSWVNRDSRHQGVGQLKVVELASNSAFFGLDLEGDTDNLKGTFYARAEELDLTPWLNQFVKTDNEVTKSRGNFVFWAGIEDSAVTEVQVELNESEFAWKTPDTEVEASIVGGHLYAKPMPQGWNVDIDNLALRSGDESLISSWSALVNKNGDTYVNSRTSVGIDALLPLFPLVFDQQSHELVEQLSPSVNIDDVYLAFNGTVSAYATFSDMSWQQADSLPGIKGMSGDFSWHDGRGNLSLSVHNSTLEIDNLLPDNIDFQQLSFDLLVESQAQGIEIVIPELTFASELVSFKQSLQYRSLDNYLAIEANVDPLSVEKVKALFPAELMGNDTRDYLTRALVSGRVEGAQIIWAGAMDKFPFEKSQGVFQAAVQISDAEFSFDERWPSLTDFDISLLFENESLTMWSERGQLMDVELQDLHAVIPTLESDAVLTIDAVGKANGEQVTQLMLASDLADSVGSTLDTGVKIGGEVVTSLNLHIPLTGEDVVATGRVALADNNIYLPDLDITFAEATGEVSFINDKVEFEQLDAALLGQAVKVGFSGYQDQQGDYLADINIDGDWDITPLVETYHEGFKPYLEGQGAWTAKVDLSIGEKDFNYKLQIDSQLQQLSSKLPEPFAKDAGQNLPLIVRSEGNNQASNVTLTLGDEISFVGVLPHKEFQFSRAHLAIGKSEFVGLGLGFSISADMKEMDFAHWYGAISALITHIPSSDSPILAEPQRIYVDVDNLLLFGQSLQNLELVAKHSNEDWQLEFNAEQARAKVLLHYDWFEKGIEVEADYINLTEWQGQNGDSGFKPELASLPPISFNCRQCRFQGKDLGQVELALSRVSDGMQIDTLQMRNPNGEVKATGTWYLSDSGSSTRLIGDFNSSDFGAFLKGFDIDSGIKDSTGDFGFDLSWQHAPYEFNLATLNGDVNWRLSDGYLSEVSDKGSRIFSILSLQSLVRKLSLDFRDVFAKGFFYDKMGGSFQVVDGTADTQDTVIDGGAGEMTIAGHTDLSSQELDYTISFAPNVTSSVPLLVYWMVNPATAIAALAIDQVLTEAKVISNVQYSLTGTLDEPILTELGRKSKDISLPAKATPPPPPGPGAQQVPDPLINQRVSVGVNNG